MNSARRPSLALVLGSFLYLWLMLGFFLGTLVLVGPVRWLIAGIHAAGGGREAENPLVIALIVVYVLFSAWLAWRLSRRVVRAPSRMVAFLIPAVSTVAALSAVVAWKNPGRMLANVAGGTTSNVQTASGAVFEFGPYPDAERLKQLKAHGVTTIISLQHPDVPVERPGIAEETNATRELGLQLVRAPMLPWFSENAEALATIRTLATSGHGHFYVHCGLGRDRVNIVKSMIENLGAKAVASRDLSAGLGFEERTRPFMNGTLLHLAGGTWLTPYPEKEELYGCFLEGRAGHVVLIPDSADSTQARRALALAKTLANYAHPYSVLAIQHGDTAAARRAADSVRHISPPVTIVADATPWADGKPRHGAENAFVFRDAFARDTVSLRALNARWDARPKPKVAVGKEDVSAGC